MLAPIKCGAKLGMVEGGGDWHVIPSNMQRRYPRGSPRRYDVVENGLQALYHPPAVVHEVKAPCWDWMTMLGSTYADFRPQSWRQFCFLAPFLTDHHLRRILEQTVAPAFAIARAELWAGTRGNPPTAFARQVAMYLAHVGCGLTFTEVGRLFSRDRTTVAHACGVVEDRREDVPFDRALDLLEGVMRLLTPRPA